MRTALDPRGIIGTIQGVGGASSYVFAGTLVVWRGYGAAFVVLACVGLFALVFILTAMPDTTPRVRMGTRADGA